MIQKEDRWIMEEIFRLSDQALVRMINGLFGTEYQDEEKIWKEWRDQEALSVCLKVGGMNRYEFSLRRLDGCLQICAENRGNIFVYEKMAVGDVMQIREPQILYFGKNHREEYSRTLEFPGKERVELPIRVITLEDCSARKLEENGMILFLPFLFHCICELEVSDRKKERIWKEFICHDIVEALDRSFKKGSLTAFDVQRMKQLCRHMAWKMLVREKWMQELENQEEMLSSLEADVKFLERVHEMEMNKKEAAVRLLLDVFQSLIQNCDHMVISQRIADRLAISAVFYQTVLFQDPQLMRNGTGGHG